MNLHSLTLGAVETNAYLLVQEGHAVLVDAPEGAAVAVDALLEEEGATLEALLLTHGHWDHIVDAAALARRGLRVYGHPGDQPFFEHPEVMSSFLPFPLSLEPVAVTNWVHDADRFLEIGLRFEVRLVDGHAPGNVLYHLPSEGIAFSGDSLFRRGVGRTDLPGSRPEALVESIRKRIYTLPAGTVVYPGHGPATTVAEEKAENPFVPAA
jgi:glyoxylase-like metal-dependent hydrolase (beta-lactamase superfamily II)